LLVEHEAFRDAILGSGSEVVSTHEGVTTVGMAEAVPESALSGLTVAV
jgi:hypothetical protein